MIVNYIQNVTQNNNKEEVNTKATISFKISILITSLFLFSCATQEDIDIKFTPPKPSLLISKVYFNSNSLIADYEYNSTNQLLKRVLYNPTSMLESFTTEYEYENGLLKIATTTEITTYQDINTSDTTIYYEEYQYDGFGWLIAKLKYRGPNQPQKIAFKYNSRKQISAIHFDSIKSVFASFSNCADKNDFYFDPILYFEYEYDENGNAISDNTIHCVALRKVSFSYDNKYRPTDGLGYVPRNDFFSLIFQTRYAPSLSQGNVINNGELGTYQYTYNEQGFPRNILEFYNGFQTNTFDIEYIEPR